MAWYRTGTISATNGSTTVTGSGTSWVSATNIVHAGGLVAPDGKVYEIASVNSDTSLTLASPYLGNTSSGQDYAILPTRALATEWLAAVQSFQAQVQGWQDGPLDGLFADGSVGAPGIGFAGQTNTGWHRPSSSVMAGSVNGTERVRFTNSGAEVTGLIGGTAVQQSPSDTTDGRLMTAGAFGLGETALSKATFDSLFSGDFNTVVRVSGRFSLSGAGIANGPPIGAPLGVLDQQVYTGGVGSERIYQTFYRMNGSAAGDFGIFARYYFYGDGWSPWRRIDNERGSDPNGDYVRFPDGTQICTSRVISGSADDIGAGVYGNPYSTANLTWTYPKAFVETPVVDDHSWISIDNNHVCKANIPNATPTGTGTFRIVSLSNDTTGQTANTRLRATGRWF